jgi:nicotinamide-nucleotide amidase
LGKSAELICVGTELLMGQIVNTHGQFIAQALARHGVSHYHQAVVGDNLGRLTAAIRQALGRADMVILSGGLGPTQDDLTKEAVAAALGVPLRLRQDVWDGIVARFSRRGLEPTPNNRRQAELPEGAEPIPNPHGTAPGVLCELPPDGRRVIVCLPGPPNELRPMVRDFLEPYLDRWAGPERQVLMSRILKVCGVGESAVEHRIRDIMAEATNPTVAPYAKPGEVQLRLTARADSPAAAEALLAPLEAKLRERLDPHVFGVDDETLEGAVGALLRSSGRTLAVAESCTGGLLGGRLTEVAGASDYFLFGAVTYANAAKVAVLGVPESDILSHGAVSAEVARAMAAGARRVGGADIGLGVTGIAGPGGGSAGKPVGTVWLGLATPEGTWARHSLWPGLRADIRWRATQEALVWLRSYLLFGARAAEEG